MSKARDRSSKQDGAPLIAHAAVASAAQNNFGPPPTPSAFARTMSVFRREFASYFATPVAAVFIVMFVAIAALLSFQMAGLYTRGQADLRSFFQWQPWLGMFFMPALGMRLWSDERRSGSIEL